jgi:hypothetical protein
MTANTPQSRKARGRKAQQQVRDRLIEVLGIDPLDIESRSMGASGADLILSKAAREKFPYAVEVKNQERLNIWDSWKQTETNGTKDGLTPLLVIRRNRQKPLVVIDLEDFLCVLKQITTS